MAARALLRAWRFATNSIAIGKSRGSGGTAGPTPKKFFCVCLWNNPLRSSALPRGFLLRFGRKAAGGNPKR